MKTGMRQSAYEGYISKPMLRPRNACAIIIPSYKLYSIGDGTMSGEMFLFVFLAAIIFLCITVVIVVAGTISSTVAATNDDDDLLEEE